MNDPWRCQLIRDERHPHWLLLHWLHLVASCPTALAPQSNLKYSLAGELPASGMDSRRVPIVRFPNSPSLQGMRAMREAKKVVLRYGVPLLATCLVLLFALLLSPLNQRVP